MLPRPALAAIAALALLSPSLAADPFPVTITHGLGQTTIPAEPERILTLGWMSQDVVLALGHVPVAIPLQSWGGDENGILPWVAASIETLGAPIPERLTTAQLPYEQILVLEPDLILAPYSDLDAEKYARLSSIAPTIGWSEGPFAGNWQDITKTIGQALGQSAEAESLIAGVEAQLAEAEEAHPEFKGKTFAFGYLDQGANSLGIYVATDPRVKMLEGLGLVLAPSVAALAPNGSFSVPVSFENLSSIDADILITWHGDQAELDALNANPLFARFRPVAGGHHLAIVDRSFAMAMSAPSVLSIPWALDRLVPDLAEILGN